MEIKEVYDKKGYPVSPRNAVERCLGTIPEKYLAGLKTIVLRESASLNRDRRRTKVGRKGHRSLVRDSLGVYHKAWKGEPAWIEIFVDNLLKKTTSSRLFRVFVRFPFLRDLIFGEVLFHEVGHHIHGTLRPERGEAEHVADWWKDRLLHDFLRKKYWYIAYPGWVLLLPFSKLLAKKKKRM